ncbi:MAG: ThuA domain-containing protein [Opitutales bacterium]
MAKSALIVSGGWEGHQPAEISRRIAGALREQALEVTVAESLDCLDDGDVLKGFDLIVPNWTMGELSGEREKHLSAAVQAGTGFAGLHGGMGDAFRGAITFKWMVGGMFVGHPHVGKYRVDKVQNSSPIVAALPESFEYTSEQYYLMVDPAIEVLATTVYEYEQRLVTMPVAWTKTWGKGRVFYNALGHDPQEYDDYPFVWQMSVEGMRWACR